MNKIEKTFQELKEAVKNENYILALRLHDDIEKLTIECEMNREFKLDVLSTIHAIISPNSTSKEREEYANRVLELAEEIKINQTKKEIKTENNVASDVRILEGLNKTCLINRDEYTLMKYIIENNRTALGKVELKNIGINENNLKNNFEEFIVYEGYAGLNQYRIYADWKNKASQLIKRMCTSEFYNALFV